MWILGKFREEIKIEEIAKFGFDLGATIREPFVVGMDSRAGSFPLHIAIVSGLSASGCNVANIGYVPSPVIARVAREESMWGVYVSADPYPPDYVGLTVYNPSGRAWEGEIVPTRDGFPIGRVANVDLVPNYIAELLAMHDLEKFKIVVDCANSPCGNIAPAIMRASGSEVFEINSALSPIPSRNYYPTRSNLLDLFYLTLRKNADLGVGFDGSGKKAVFTDGKVFVNSSKAMGIIMKVRGYRRAIVDVGASFVLDYVASVKRVPSDEVKVGKALEEKGYAIGGGSLGVIFSEWSFSPDAIYLALEILQIMSDTGKTFKDPLEELPESYEDSLILRADPEKTLENAKDELKDYEIDFRDGVKAFMEEGWLWVKPMKDFVLILERAL